MRECYLVCYDIACPRRLRKVARMMQGAGERVQKSVFECWLTPADLRAVLTQSAALIDSERDSLRVYRLCAHCTARRTMLGIGELHHAPVSAII